MTVSLPATALEPEVSAAGDPLQRPAVLLLGQDCVTGLQTARILAARGVPVFGLAGNPRSAFSRTRALRRAVAWSSHDSPKQLPARGALGPRPLLLPCTDEAVLWLSAHREALAKHFRFVLPSDGVLALLADKSRFYRHALAEGLAVPDTLFLDQKSDCDAVGERLGFPCIVKPPRSSTPEWRAVARQKAFLVQSAQELGALFERTRHAVRELIAQRWVEGGDDEMYSLYTCLDTASRPLAQLVAHKLRQWPLDTGCGSLAEHCEEPELVERGLALLRSAAFVGLSSVQFKRDARTGRFYVIEVNAGRPALNMPLAEKCGVPMLYTFYCDALGLPLPEPRHVLRPGAKWICWRTDLAASWSLMRQGRLTPRAWLRSLRGPRFEAVLSWRDPMPFLLDLGRKLPVLWRGGAES